MDDSIDTNELPDIIVSPITTNALRLDLSLIPTELFLDEFVWESSVDGINSFLGPPLSPEWNSWNWNPAPPPYPSENIRIKVSYSHNLICCICYCDSGLKTVSTFDDTPVKINDVILSNLYNKRIDSDFILLGPCGQHATCISCLQYLALDFTNHMINENYSFIRCCDPSTCASIMDIPTFYDHSQIKKFLSPTQYNTYHQHAEIYEFPGYHKKRCPHCNTFNIIPNDKIKDTPRGELIVECAQNCHRNFCFYCDSNVTGFYIKHCIPCSNSNLLTDPNRKNSYFYKPLESRKTPDDILLKNNELTPDIIISQLLEIVNPDNDVAVKCFTCLCLLYKTEQCNTLDHCKIEICYCCGKIGEKLYSWKLGDHWSELGLRGCPRFDSAPYWNQTANCNFRCRDSKCHDYSLGDCVEESHQSGILNMKEERKSQLIYHKLKSLLSGTRDHITQIIIDNHPDLYPFVPDNSVFTDLENDISHYYTYSHRVWHPESEDL